MSARLKMTLVVRNPDTMQAVALVEGSEVPDWAVDLVHPDDLDGAPGPGSGKSSPEPTGWASKNRPELEAEVAARNADRADEAKVVAGGKGNKPDLVAALEADDAAIAAAAASGPSDSAGGSNPGAGATGTGDE